MKYQQQSLDQPERNSYAMQDYKMEYKKTLERAIKKVEKEQDAFLQAQECNEYQLGYEDGLKFALKEYDKRLQNKTTHQKHSN